MVLMSVNLLHFETGQDYSLSWEERLHIALDAAQGPLKSFTLF